MSEREKLEQAIATTEVQRDALGDEAADTILAGLRRQLAELGEAETESQDEPPNLQPSRERRIVTILFCDVTGSTALAESMDPEAWTAIMQEVFAYLIEPVERYGGNVARLMGDAILAFFGAPTAHEDDPQRAVLAGLDIIKNIRPYREKLKREQRLDFNVRVGINTGLAVVGDVGSDSAGEYTAMGDAVNLAARMEQTASPGTVQIAQETYTLVAPLFEFESLGGISVKGKRQPVPAYRVLSRKMEPGQLRGLTGHGISSPLIGRESELEAARTALEKLKEGQGGIFLIIGEAGIGKSRLLAELHDNAVGAVREPPQPELDDGMYGRVSNPPVQHIRWLEGHTLSYGQSISYWPFQEMLREEAGITEEDSEAEAFDKFEAHIQALFPQESVDILPYLANLLALEKAELTERFKYLDGEDLGRLVYRAAWRYFRALAESAPLALVFDDLHWMDASSAGLLEHLLPLTKQTPILICGLSRPDPESPVVRLRQTIEKAFPDRSQIIELAPLSSEDSGKLVHNLLEIDGLPGHVREMMVAKADGNPFYLEEIVRSLIEAGALAQDASTGRWRATQQIERVTVPDTIQGLLIARIDRLDEALKHVIRRAAVIGRTFLYRVLNVVLEVESDLDQELDQLERIELIKQKQQLPELEYIFKHALAQEAAYDSILLQERQTMHAQVGETIETLMADRLDEFYGLLAYHFSAAEDWERAQDYLFKAGDQAGAMAADTEALTHYRQAMQAYARVRGDDWDPVERARLERKMGEALARTGEHDQARAYLERSLALLGEPLPQTRWGTRLAIGRALLTQLAHKILPRLFVRPMGSAPDPVTEENFLASQALSFVELLANAERYLLLSVRALNTSERGGFAYGSAHLSSSMALAAAFMGVPKVSLSYFRQSAVYAEQIKPYRPVPQLELARAGHNNMIGDWPKSLEYGLRGVEMARSTGDMSVWGPLMNVVTFAYCFLGRVDEAMSTSLELLNFAEESSYQQLICYASLAYGFSLRRRGLVDEAISSYRRGIKIAEELPDYVNGVGLGAWLGRCYLDKGNLEQGVEVLEAAEELFNSKGGNLPGYTYLGNGLSEAYLLMAEQSEGEVRRMWLNKARNTGQKTLKKSKILSHTLPETYLFLGRYEWLKGKPRAAQKWWEKALDYLADADVKGGRYERALVYLEIGRRLEDRKRIEESISILEDIGAAFDLNIARQALLNFENTP